MKYEIKKLSKETKHNFFSLFEDSQFAHQKSWKTCFCRFYHTDCSYEDWMKRSGLDNMKEADVEIDSDNMSGFLAFEGDLCVGWLNAGPVPFYKRLINDLLPEYVNDKTALTICYVIKEGYRERGIASLLLNQAIDYFRELGFTRMIALPTDNTVRERNYRGFTQMYLNRGYKEIISESGDRYLVLEL